MRKIVFKKQVVWLNPNHITFCKIVENGGGKTYLRCFDVGGSYFDFHIDNSTLSEFETLIAAVFGEDEKDGL